MTSAQSDDTRRMVPIWRSMSSAAAAGELRPVKPQAQRSRPNSPEHNAPDFSVFVAQATDAWRRGPGIDSAADLVGAALSAGHPAKARDAAAFLLSRPNEAAPGVLHLAQKVLDHHAHSCAAETPTGTGHHRSLSAEGARAENAHTGAAVALARAYTRAWPTNAIAWANLALAYADIGKSEQAQRAGRVSLELAPTNRLVLRNISRMHIHHDRPDEAHHLLRSNSRTPHDPWLLAAEISTASVAHRRPKYFKQARRAIERGYWAPFDASELSACIATQLFFSGQGRPAQKLLDRALQSPSENATSQGEWLLHNNFASDNTRRHLESKRTAEAWALCEKSERFFEPALQRYADWLDSEPYSTRPAVFGSYVASVALADPEATIYFCLRGLVANNDEWILWNNLAVGYFLNDDIHLGFNALRRARDLTSDPDDHATLNATAGLASYRTGDVDRGRSLYEQALSHFRRTRKESSLRIAALYFIQEELRNQTSEISDELVDIATNIHTNEPEIEQMAQRVKNQYLTRQEAS